MPEEEPENVTMANLFNSEKKEVQFVYEDFDSKLEIPKSNHYVYDPANIESEFSHPNMSAYSPLLLKELEVSCMRYKHYIEDSEGIRPTEISKYNKDWMSNALNLVYPGNLLKQYNGTVKELFQEVLNTYVLAMKKAILDYILRAPAERKRLHILMIPREVPPSSDKIAIQGGYSLKIYQQWHKSKKDAENEIKLKMICNNIVMGSLLNWWHDFRDIKLIKFEGIKAFCNASGHRLSFEAFLKITYMFRIKTLHLLKDIWHRGAIMIIKRFKFLKQRGLSDGKWTYSGFLNNGKSSVKIEPNDSNEDTIFKYIKAARKVHNINKETIEEGLEFDSMLENLHNELEMEELVDVRENSAYIAFVQLIGGYINYEEDGYDILAKEYKRELKYAGGNLMTIQLREIIDRSVKEITDFFDNIPNFDEFQKCFEETEVTQRKASLKTRVPEKAAVSTKAVPTVDIKQPSLKRQLTTSKDSKYTKRGMIISDEHRKFRERLKERHQKNKDIENGSAIDEPVEMESELILPPFMKNDFVMNPFIELYLKLEDEELSLDNSENDIVNQVIKMIDQLINSCNSFVRPEFCKLHTISSFEFAQQEEEEARINKLTFQQNKKENEFEDLIFGGLNRNIYSKYIGRIKLSESEKDQKDIIFSKEETNIYKRSFVKKYMKVADWQEECYVQAKQKIEEVLREQYRACSNVYVIFNQLIPIITKQMDLSINRFLAQKTKPKADYFKFIAELKNYKNL